MSDLNSTSHSACVAKHYDSMYRLHRLAWTNGSELALHCGYWDSQTRTHRQSLINLNRIVANRAGIVATDTILDAGCGLGGSAIWLAQTYGVHVTGITIAKEQARRAHNFARKEQVDHLAEFLVQDYAETSFPDESFDVVWAIESVYHAQAKIDFFREAWRVLKPGGRLIVADWLRRTRNLSATEERILQQWFDAFAIIDLDTPEKYMMWMQEIGFKNMSFQDITLNIRPSLRIGYRLAILAVVPFEILRVLRLIPSSYVKYARGTWLMYHASHRGLWLPAIFSANKPPG